jgi:hypothetical protein
VEHTCHPSYTRSTNKRIKAILEKYLKVKRDGGVAQVAAHLPDKCKALSSNPSTALPRKKTWRTERVEQYFQNTKEKSVKLQFYNK